MRGLLREYGIFCTSVIGVLAFFFVFNHILADEETSIVKVYNGSTMWNERGFQSVDALDDDMVSSLYGITDTMQNAGLTSVPMFEVSDTKDYVYEPEKSGTIMFNESPLTVYKDTVDVTRDFLLDGIDAYYYDASGSKVSIDKNNITVLVTQYEPYVSYDDATISYTGTTIVEEVQAVDMFGNPLFKSDGSPVIVERYAYKGDTNAVDSDAELKLANEMSGYGTFYSTEFEPGGSGITVSKDIPYKFKVLYRVEHGTMKAEYTAIFTSLTRPQYERVDDLYSDIYTVQEERNPLDGTFSTEAEEISNDLFSVPEYTPTVTEIWENGEDASDESKKPVADDDENENEVEDDIIDEDNPEDDFDKDIPEEDIPDEGNPDDDKPAEPSEGDNNSDLDFDLDADLDADELEEVNSNKPDDKQSEEFE